MNSYFSGNPIWQYLFLGLLQGIFEWLPISSEGIVALFSQFLKIEFSPVEMALFLHLGTLLAVIIYFLKDWLNIFKLRDMGLLRFLILATIISLLVGYPLYRFVQDTAVGSFLLIITGLALLLTAFFHKFQKKFLLEGDKLSLLTGFLQGLAVIPGLSRSGATIFGLSLSKMEPKKILKVSYLMSVPVVLASNILILKENPQLSLNAWPALITSFVVGLISLNFLFKLAQRIDFFKFALFFSALCFLGAFLSFLI